MIRMGLGLFLVAALIVAALALNGEPGTANLTWLGWRVDTTAAAAVLLIDATGPGSHRLPRRW